MIVAAQGWMARFAPLVRVLVALTMVALAFMAASPASAQVTTRYTNTTDSATGFINETNTPCSNPYTRTFTVGSNYTISDVNIGVLLAHTYRGDLLMWLVSPSGTRIQLASGDGAGADNYNVLFDDSAASAISNYTANATATASTTVPPYAATYRPASVLSGFNGQSSAGTWTLEICDRFNGDSGTFYQADLYLTST
ncbi:MAG: proprotein convertase P-domain-containing protein, partial [Sphingomonadaceae bacterium]|nr:proprotein convertase P-domain-containing protein [Sphingomonadaceae bacterium]